MRIVGHLLFQLPPGKEKRTYRHTETQDFHFSQEALLHTWQTLQLASRSPQNSEVSRDARDTTGTAQLRRQRIICGDLGEKERRTDNPDQNPSEANEDLDNLSSAGLGLGFRVIRRMDKDLKNTSAMAKELELPGLWGCWPRTMPVRISQV